MVGMQLAWLLTSPTANHRIQLTALRAAADAERLDSSKRSVMRFIYLLMIALMISACGEENSQVSVPDGTDPPDEIDVWKPLGPALPAPVTSLCSSDSGLIAATSEGINGWPTEAILWRWSDSTWVKMATPLIGSVATMRWFQGALVVGGFFEVEGDPSTRSLAQWDGSAWHPVGPPLMGAGMNLYPFVGPMIVWRDRLVIGGFFTIDRTGGVAIWDGQTLESLDNILAVTALAVWGDTLIAGGRDGSDVMCNPGARLEKWTDEQWVDFAGGVRLSPEDDCPPHVFVAGLLTTGDGIIVSGSIPIDDQPVQTIARWTGEEWFPMGLETLPYHLLEAKGHLFAAESRVSEPSQVWRWCGSGWSTVGEGFDGPVHELAVVNGDLIAAGAFTERVVRARLDEIESPKAR
jgi:hypothetical protein